jgi:hypothetical protein
MADAKNYSENESWERIYNGLIGTDPNDQQGFLGQMAQNEALSKIAQLIEGTLGLRFRPLDALTDRFGGIYTWTGTVTMEGIPAAWTRVSGSFQNSMLYSDYITPQPTQDRILINDYGVYEVDWSISFQGSPDIEYMFEPYCWVGMPQAAATVTPIASGSVIEASGSGYAYASGTTVAVSLYTKPSTASAWLKLRTSQIKIRKVRAT